MTQTQATLPTMSTDLASRLPQPPANPTIVSQTAGTVRYAERQMTAPFGYAHEQGPNGAARWFLSEHLQAPQSPHGGEYATDSCLCPVRLEQCAYGVRDDGKALSMQLRVRRLEKAARYLFTFAASEPDRSSQALIPRACAPLRECPPRRLVLIVNHPGLRDAMCMLLRVEGYQVISVASLEEAHQALRDGIDLVVTDHYLRNGQRGEQVIAALRKDLHVSIKAVLMSWRTSAMIGAIGNDPDLRIVSNPLYPETLLRLVRELTTGEQTPPS